MWPTRSTGSATSGTPSHGIPACDLADATSLTRSHRRAAPGMTRTGGSSRAARRPETHDDPDDTTERRTDHDPGRGVERRRDAAAPRLGAARRADDLAWRRDPRRGPRDRAFRPLSGAGRRTAGALRRAEVALLAHPGRLLA